MRLVRMTFILIIIISFLSCLRSESSTSADYSKTPVFFVHGLGCNVKYWGSMISHLQNAGYAKQFLRTIQLEPGEGSNIMHAEKLIAPAIEDFLKSVNDFLALNTPELPPKVKVDIIAHSMGAVSTRWYCAKVRPERVRTWISLTGANHGSNAGCAWKTPGPRETCPAFAKNEKLSYLQFTLNGKPFIPDVDETPFGIGADSPGVDSVPPDENRRILYVSIRIDPDKWIKPEDSAILDGTGGNNFTIPQHIEAVETSAGNILMPKCTDHDGIVKCLDAMKLIEHILSR